MKKRSTLKDQEKKVIRAMRNLAARGNFKRVSAGGREERIMEHNQTFYAPRRDYGTEDKTIIGIINLAETGGYAPNKEGRIKVPIKDVTYNLYLHPEIVYELLKECPEVLPRHNIEVIFD